MSDQETPGGEQQPEMSLAEMGQALAGTMTEQHEQAPDPVLAEWTAQAEPAPEQQPEVKSEQWVHEPTGKAFDNELDMLRYESGWKSQQHGEELKKLREQVEGLGKQPEQKPEQQAQPSKDDLKKMFFPNLSESDRDDPLVDIMLEGVLNAGEAQYRVYQQSLGELKGELAALKQSMESSSLRTKSGIDETKEAEMLKQYPELADLPLAGRISVLKRLNGELESAAQAAPKPPRAGEYVEGSSARSEQPTEDSFARKFDKLGNEKDELKVLGSMWAKSGFLNA